MADLCPCSTWARTDGRITDHHPNCHAFRQKRYVRIKLEGGGIYVQPEDDLNVLIDEVADAEPGAKWTLELIEMTKEEHDRLPEFDGH